MNMKDIYTVILHSLTGDEDSTVSFEDYDDAVDYIVNEELVEAGASKKEMAEIKEFLQNERSVKYGNWEYTICNAKLVLAK